MSRRAGDIVGNTRLDSWKQIAVFFGRDERTVKRWEKNRSLPVHRVPGNQRGGVFAYSHELTQWLNSSADKAVGSTSPEYSAGAEVVYPPMLSQPELPAIAPLR